MMQAFSGLFDDLKEKMMSENIVLQGLLNSREREIKELEKENAELKAELKALTNHKCEHEFECYGYSGKHKIYKCRKTEDRL
jgi:cell division protein FtsB